MREQIEIALSDKDKETVENILVEILLAAMRAPEHIRSWITEVAIGIANCLDEERVNRAKEYARYRYKQVGAATDGM